MGVPERVRFSVPDQSCRCGVARGCWSWGGQGGGLNAGARGLRELAALAATGGVAPALTVMVPDVPLTLPSGCHRRRLSVVKGDRRPAAAARLVEEATPNAG